MHEVIIEEHGVKGAWCKNGRNENERIRVCYVVCEFSLPGYRDKELGDGSLLVMLFM